MNFNALIPELSVSDLQSSLEFYVDVLGFRIEYDRPHDKFAFLSIENAQIMLEEVNGNWSTGNLEKPFGCGINFQIEVSDLDPMLKRLENLNHPFFRKPKNEWYRVGEVMEGQRQFLIQDPDGYLLRFAQYLGSKPLET